MKFPKFCLFGNGLLVCSDLKKKLFKDNHHQINCQTTELVSVGGGRWLPPSFITTWLCFRLKICQVSLSVSLSASQSYDILDLFRVIRVCFFGVDIFDFLIIWLHEETHYSLAVNCVIIKTISFLDFLSLVNFFVFGFRRISKLHHTYYSWYCCCCRCWFRG